jgi:hypothetical protein
LAIRAEAFSAGDLSIVPDRPRAGSTYWDILLVCLVALLAFMVHVAMLATEPLSFDEAFNLQVSLNLALGQGYQTWYAGAHPFDVRITTGPTILVPAAGVLSIVPPTAIAGRSIMIVFFAALLATLYRLGGLLSRERQSRFFVVAVLFLLAVPSFSLLSIAVMGEIPSFLLSLWAFIMVAKPARTLRDMAFAGLLFGLSLLTKLTMAICLPVFLLSVAMASWRHGLRNVLARVFVCTVASAAPLLLWHGYKCWMLGWARYKVSLVEWVEFLKTHGAGADRLPGADLPQVIQNHLQVLSQTLQRSPFVVALTLGLVLICAMVIWVRRGRNPLALAIIGSAAALNGWFLGLSNWYFYRHAVPGYCFIALTCAYLFAQDVRQLARDDRIGLAFVAIGALASVFCIPLGAGLLEAGQRVVTPSSGLVTLQRAAQRDLASLVRQIREREPKATFWGYGWFQAPDISFLAATPFHDATTERHRLGAPCYFVISPNLNLEPAFDFASKFCAEELYRQGLFLLCRLRS